MEIFHRENMETRSLYGWIPDRGKLLRMLHLALDKVGLDTIVAYFDGDLSLL